MSSREELLQALRRTALLQEPLPELDQAFTQYPDLVVQFTQAVETAAGRVVLAEPGAVANTLATLEPLSGSAAVYSLVPEAASSFSVPSDGASGEAHAFDGVDVLVFRAEFGVAENGALWVSAASAPQRSVYFLAQHHVALLDRRRLVHNLHEAYAQLDVKKAPFGCFIAGPSKTADIEQALVVGAHGARSLSVVLV